MTETEQQPAFLGPAKYALARRLKDAFTAAPTWEAFAEQAVSIALADREAAERGKGTDLAGEGTEHMAEGTDLWVSASYLIDEALESYAALTAAAARSVENPDYCNRVENREKHHERARTALDAFVRRHIALAEAGGAVPAEHSGWAPSTIERVARDICTAAGEDPDTSVYPGITTPQGYTKPIGPARPWWTFKTDDAERLLNEATAPRPPAVGTELDDIDRRADEITARANNRRAELQAAHRKPKGMFKP